MNFTINTAQNVNITCKPAGLLYRILSTLIDYLIMGGIFIIVMMVLHQFTVASKTRNTIQIITLIVLMTYHLLFELFLNGQSPGKMAFRLRAVRADGRRLTFWDCMLRWVLRLVDITVSMGTVAMISIIVSSKMQRLGDLAAGTLVILENRNLSLQSVSSDDLPEDYQVIFPQVAILSDHDIHIIKEIMKEVEKSEEYKLLTPLSLKIKEITSIQTDMNNLQFIRTVLKDYSHLTQ